MKKITLLVALLCSISAFSTRYLVQGTGTNAWRVAAVGEVGITLTTTFNTWYAANSGLFVSGTDEIWLAGGTYVTDGTITLKNGVSLYGSFAGSETSTTQRSKVNFEKPWEFSIPTIIDGNNANRQGLISYSSTTLGYIDGLTITRFRIAGASTNLTGIGASVRTNWIMQNCIVSYNTFTNSGVNQCRGAGVYVQGGQLLNSYIHHNEAMQGTGTGTTYGGGVAFVSIANPALTVVKGCIIESNTSTLVGGGMAILDGTGGVLEDCIFLSNVCVAGNGGAISCSNASSTNNSPFIIKNCQFVENSSVGNGGGVALALASSVTTSIEGCTFIGNIASPPIGVWNGGGGLICTSGSFSPIKNCVFRGNSIATDCNGSAFFSGVAVSLLNCVITNNSSLAGNSSTVKLTQNGSKLLNCTLAQNLYSGTGDVLDCTGTNTIITNNIFWSNSSNTTVTPLPKNEISFVPTVLPITTEIGNPARGFHKWHDVVFPPVLPIYDVYKRFSWRLIETSKDVYDFTVIENELKALKPGQRFSTRIGALNTLNHNERGIDVPDYVESEGMGWKTDYVNTVGSKTMFVPDWNDSRLLERIEKLLLALAAKYDDDPRIGWIENGMYGNWSEWHNYPIQYPNAAGQYATPPGTSTAQPMYRPVYAPSMPDPNNPSQQKYREGSSETIQRILLANTNPFKHKQLIQSTSNLPILFQALNLTKEKPIGIRRDSWGDPYFNDITKYQSYKPTAAEWTLFNNRWKTAPFFTENWGGALLSETEMLNQLSTFEISAIAFGGIGVWANLSAATQASFLKYARSTGYRYQVSNVTATLSDNNLSLTTDWKNINIAPTYENWTVKAYVVNPITDISFSSNIDIPVNLKDLLNGSVSPISKTISIPLTDGWESQANLEVRIIINDSNNYLKPMNLDMAGQNTDRSYTLFKIDISNGEAQLKK